MATLSVYDRDESLFLFCVYPNFTIPSIIKVISNLCMLILLASDIINMLVTSTNTNFILVSFIVRLVSLPREYIGACVLLVKDVDINVL